MDKASLIEYYGQFSDDELFYKSYYEAQGNEESIKIIMERLRQNKSQFPGIWLPELNMRGARYLSELFLDKTDGNVLIIKHCRYNPLFVHYHEFFEMIYVLKGNCVNNVQGKDILMNEGDICIIEPGVWHTIGVFDDDSIIMNILVKKNTFDETFFDGYQSCDTLSVLNYHTEEGSATASILYLLFSEAAQNQENASAAIENLLKALFVVLKREKAEQISLEHKFDRDIDVNEILNYVQIHYKKITFTLLSEHFHLSQSYLRKIIKQCTGKSFIDIVRGIRMERACKLLKETDMSISAISEYVGYNTADNFIRHFKKQYAETPSEYRKNRRSS